MALSLNARLLLAASLVLAAFLGLTGITLDRAFRESALTAAREQLQAQVFMLLGAADLDDGGRLALPDALPEARFSTPGSGLYAAVLDGDGAAVWRSASLLGRELRFPVPEVPGEAAFSEMPLDGAAVLALSFAVTWETTPGAPSRYVFGVAQDMAAVQAQLASFRRSLWGWLAGSVVVLLAVQGSILRWSLAPLRRVARGLADIEAGRQRRLDGRYPRELAGLTENLNALLGHADAQLERYRNALGDLAHSLKTPLAVLRGSTESADDAADLRATVSEQVARMNDTVEYQLQRAAAAGRRALAAPVPVADAARKVTASLAKVHADRKLELRAEIAPGTAFPGDEGDLTEVLGNLVDNACKWAASRVTVRARTTAEGTLELEVEDDGPGIPADRREQILQRGGRADPKTPGHGIGLAVVREIVEGAYGGRLELEGGPAGGTRVSVRVSA